MVSRVCTGLDRIARQEGPTLGGRKVSLLCHPASVDSHLRSAVEVVRESGAQIQSLMGPEHGLEATAQDMIGVKDGGGSTGPSQQAPVYSLYGDGEASLWPQDSYFGEAELLIIDLQDIGSRYYTYVWTAVMASEVALKAGREVLLLDRPNPLGGLASGVEGGEVLPEFRSFVGFHDVAVRHQMTIAELCTMALQERGQADLGGFSVLECKGWMRELWGDECGLPWVLPSPNMPTMDTATVYPGQCLWEGTLVSEGRGTTRPFEFVGAPFVDAARWRADMRNYELPGLQLREMAFEPGFQKHRALRCAGLQLHVGDRKAVRSWSASIALLSTLYEQAKARGLCLGAGELPPVGPKGHELARSHFCWRSEVYEFVDDIPAIDLLAGGAWLREGIESGVPVAELVAHEDAARERFLQRRAAFLRYPEA